MLAMVATPGEAAALAGLPEADASAAFFRLWTVKEAVLKAAGSGLAGGAKRVTVPAALLTGTARSATLEALGRAWQVEAAEACGVQLALATEAPPMRTENGPIS